MPRYEFAIEDEGGDSVEFKYHPEDEPAIIAVFIRDVDGSNSIPVWIDLTDAKALKKFLGIMIKIMETTKQELTKELDSD